jgi:hypothetical protein
VPVFTDQTLLQSHAQLHLGVLVAFQHLKKLKLRATSPAEVNAGPSVWQGENGSPTSTQLSTIICNYIGSAK